MTSIKTAFVALALVASLGAPAFAAANDTDAGYEPERECAFDAAAGGYVCEDFDVGGSLSDLGDQNGKKKIKLKFPVKAI